MTLPVIYCWTGAQQHGIYLFYIINKQKNNDVICAVISYIRPSNIPFPRSRACLGQHQESRPLEKLNTRSQQFTDLPSHYACLESSLTNLIGWEYETISLNALKIAPSKKSRFLWLPEAHAASGDGNKNARINRHDICSILLQELALESPGFKMRTGFFRLVANRPLTSSAWPMERGWRVRKV